MSEHAVPRDAHRISSRYRGAQVQQKLYVLNHDGSFHCVAHQTLTLQELRLMIENIETQLEIEQQESMF